MRGSWLLVVGRVVVVGRFSGIIIPTKDSARWLVVGGWWLVVDQVVG